MYRIKGFSFIVWWLTASILVWPVAVVALGAILFPLGALYSVMFSGSYNYLMDQIAQVAMIPLAGAIVGFAMSSMQRWLLRSRLYWAADGWRLWSVVGGAVGGFMLFLLFYSGPYYGYYPLPSGLGSDTPLIAMPIFLAFVAACQMMPLRHAVRHPWLWFVANIVAGVAFVGVLTNNQADYYSRNSTLIQLGVLGLSLASLGLVTGFAMLHLFERHILPMKPEDASDLPAAGPRSVWDDAI